MEFKTNKYQELIDNPDLTLLQKASILRDAYTYILMEMDCFITEENKKHNKTFESLKNLGSQEELFNIITELNKDPLSTSKLVNIDYKI